MRTDGIFIGIEVDDGVRDDADLAKRLDEACPVDIYDGSSGRIEIRRSEVDECVLCRLCLDAAPDGAVRVLKLYDDEAAL